MFTVAEYGQSKLKGSINKNYNSKTKDQLLPMSLDRCVRRFFGGSQLEITPHSPTTSQDVEPWAAGTIWL